MGAEITGDGAVAATARDRVCLEVVDQPESVRDGRLFVRAQLRGRVADTLIDDAALIAAELLANAVQHGEPPLFLCVRVDPNLVRIEVQDGSSRSPVRPAPSTTNMTGRGIALIEALSHRWGVDRRPGEGKTVWSELLPIDAGGERVSADDLEDMLAKWDDEPESAVQRYTVVLGDVPTDLLIAAKAHIDNLVREFSLAAASGSLVPEPLAELIETVVHGFSEARVAIKRQAVAASRRGKPRTGLTLHLPLTAADAGEAYLTALDEADEYARAARLLTLETPADHRLFRHWYVEAVVSQLRRIAVGEQPDPVVPFEDRLVAEIRRLSEVARRTARAAQLQRVTAALARSRTPSDVADVVVSEGVAALGASGGGLLVPSGDGEHIAVPGAVGYGEELVGALREERLDAPLPAAMTLRTGESVWIETQEERDLRFPMMRGFEASTIAMCAVPLFVGDRLLGALRFSFSTGKLFDSDERAFVQALAALTAQTLQRTEIYEAERRATLELQRALLPQSIIGLDGWEFAAYYSPAGGQEAGGDFYDVLPLPDGRLAAIVGDVMGRGVAAAAAMAQVRSTIRAYAVDDPDPVRVFERVDKFFATLEFDQIVTVVYFLLDPTSGRVLAASAGHLPPLVVDESGCQVVSIPVGLPFGVTLDERAMSSIELTPGRSLIAITDGLVERRGEDIDEGVSRLVQACRGTAALSASDMVKHVVASATSDRDLDDDVTALVLRRL
jgi:serine phosphatase RsbU (regulator of sigma subunit)/anti-sigma regulatory factor (Ser/Thr protein kinase)